VRAYLSAYGPATAEQLSSWISRGRIGKRQLRSWFDGLRDEVVKLDVEGETMYCLEEHADSVAAARPSRTLRLLPGFDQWVLGPGTDDPHIIPPGQRAAVSRQAGWIAPVAVVGGIVCGTWRLDGSRITIDWFEGIRRPSARAINVEVARLGAAVGSPIDIHA
jgi:hypothetical protein